MPPLEAAPMTKTTDNRRRTARVPVQPEPLAETGVRAWLRMNGYADIANLITVVMGKWRMSRVTTRRNWWDILAGDACGASRVIRGHSFPVLAAAQRRQGKPVTPNAIERTPGERAPAV